MATPTSCGTRPASSAAPDRTHAAVELVVVLYTGPLFRAALHLWVAASSDEQLRAQIVPLEAHVGREAHKLTLDLLGVHEREEGVREAVQATLDLARGLGLANLLTDDGRRRQRVVRQWARMLENSLSATRPV